MHWCSIHNKVTEHNYLATQCQSNDINDDTTDHTHMVFARKEQKIIRYEMHVVLSGIVNEYLVTIKSSTQSVGNSRAGQTTANHEHNDNNRLNFSKLQLQN